MRLLTQMRRRALMDEDWQSLIFWAMLLALAGALYLSVNGMWALAAIAAGGGLLLAWYGGVWLLSPATQRYLKNVANALEVFWLDVQAADAQLAVEREDLARRIDMIAFTEPASSVRDRLRSHLDAFNQVADDAERPFDQRTLLAVEGWQHVETATRQLLECANTVGQKQLARELSRSMDRYRMARAEAHSTQRAAVETTIGELTEVRVPEALESGHLAVVRALRRYGAGLDAWRRQLDSTGEIRSVAYELVQAQTELIRAADALNKQIAASSSLPEVARS